MEGKREGGGGGGRLKEGSQENWRQKLFGY